MVERAPAGHRVAGVDDQVREHLLDLSRVDLAPGIRSAVRIVTKIDVLADQPSQTSFSMSAHDGVDVQDDRLDDLPPAEGQELARESPRARPAVLDLLDVGAAGRVRARRSRAELARTRGSTVSMLLKSWATPPASRPTASIFCACLSWSSSCLSRGGVGHVAPESRPGRRPGRRRRRRSGSRAAACRPAAGIPASWFSTRRLVASASRNADRSEALRNSGGSRRRAPRRSRRTRTSRRRPGLHARSAPGGVATYAPVRSFMKISR